MTLPPPNILTIAVAKGYLLDESFKLFRQLGIEFDEAQIQKSRKLFAYDRSGQIRLLFIRPWDVSVYVEHGAADLGIVGKDVLIEKAEQVLELSDLKFGKCSLVLAGPENQFPIKLHYHIRVATKYRNTCLMYFKNKGILPQILKMYGAIELAPITGLSDIICDLAASGETLKENHLKIIDTLVESSARLIANPISFRFHYHQITQLVRQINTIL